MLLKDLQRHGQTIGKIRMGVKVARADGSSYPKKLETFRLTTNSSRAAEMAANLFGGTSREWVNGTERWEVITEASELDVMVPPGGAVVSQWYELWSAAGCLRRCDGEEATIFSESGEQHGMCVCPAAGLERKEAADKGAACKPHTRVSLMLPDLPDIGTWLLSSTGFNAAVELGGKAEMLEQARDQGVFLPAVLRLARREKRTPGKKPQVYMVPELEIGATMRQLVSGQAGGSVSQALPPAPTALALPAGTNGSAGPSPTAENPAAADAPPTTAAAGPNQTAQDYADLAAITTDAEEVRGLGREARDGGLLADTVTIDGLVGVLGDFLAHRVKALDEVVDAELVEDGPTSNDARTAAAAWAGAES